MGRDVFGVRGFFFHHYATHQARLCMNRNNLAVLLCDTEHRKRGHRAGGHNSWEVAASVHIRAHLCFPFLVAWFHFHCCDSTLSFTYTQAGSPRATTQRGSCAGSSQRCSVREGALRINWDAFFSPTQQCWRMRRVSLPTCRVGCYRAGWALIAAGFSRLMEVDAGGDATDVFPSLNPPDCFF